jgi:hypothetical protein
MPHRVKAIGSILALLLTSCGVDFGDMDAVYKNHAEAVADGAFTRGWLSDFTPDSAIEIHESHSVQTNEGWLTFTFNREDETAMTAKLVPIDVSHVTFPERASTARRPWWPKELRKPSDKLRSRFTFFTYDDKRNRDQVFVAIERNTPRAWCWCLSG